METLKEKGNVSINNKVGPTLIKITTTLHLNLKAKALCGALHT